MDFLLTPFLHARLFFYALFRWAYRTGGSHWIATFIVSVTGTALLIAFSLAACSDPGIVYRSVERSAEVYPPGRNVTTDPGLSAGSMESGGVLCGGSLAWTAVRNTCI